MSTTDKRKSNLTDKQMLNSYQIITRVTKTAENLRDVILKKQKSSEEGTLFLVEQEPVLQEAYSKILKPLGFEIKCISDGSLVYAELIKTKCKLMIIDPMLPGIDGLEITRTIREIFRLDFPIIALSNLNSKSIIKEAYVIGIDDYLVKTDIEAVDLIKSVKRRL